MLSLPIVKIQPSADNWKYLSEALSLPRLKNSQSYWVFLDSKFRLLPKGESLAKALSLSRLKKSNPKAVESS